eukprot:7233419-Prymnesium_polylepis.1
MKRSSVRREQERHPCDVGPVWADLPERAPPAERRNATPPRKQNTDARHVHTRALRPTLKQTHGHAWRKPCAAEARRHDEGCERHPS